MSRYSNYQDLLKTIAIIAMIIDHLGFYFFPEANEFRIIGRYAMPIFAFFAGYNFKNSIKYSILFYGVLLYIVSVFFIHGDFIAMNILISIFLGHIFIYIFQKHLHSFLKGYICFIILAISWPITYPLFDYGGLVIGVMILGYMSKIKAMNIQLSAFIIAFISLLHTYAVFDNFFTSIELFFTFLIAVIIYLSINYSNFEKPISFNLKIISRYSMLIYFFHLMIFQLIWRYYYIVS